MRVDWETMIVAAPDAIIATDRSHRVVLCNNCAQRMFGYRREEVHGRPIDMLLPGGLEWLFEYRFASSPNPSAGEPRQILGRRQGGAIFPVEVAITTMDMDGQEGSLIILRDITGRQRREETLRTSDEMLHTIINVSPLAIFAVDDTKRVVLWNPAAEQLFGWESREVIGLPLPIIPEDGQAEFRRLFRRVLQGESITQTELRRQKKDGTIIDINASLSGLPNGRGEIIGYMVIAADITARKQAEKDLKALAAELARSNAELEQFAYVASHDLQEPLRMVASYTQLLARRYKGRLDADADEFIAYAVDGAARMQKLIHDLLAYSRVRTRGSPFQPVNCGEILRHAIENLRATISEQDAVVTYDPLPVVRGDASQLGQVFQNLLSNAMTFRSEAPPRVHVTAVKEPGEWIFSVQDNGTGLDPKYADRIFKVFQRLHPAAQYPGTGIGLAICKQIVERHGGRIWVESQRGEGARFSFSIPVS